LIQSKPQTSRFSEHVKGLKQGASLIIQRNGVLGEGPPTTIPTWGLK